MYKGFKRVVFKLKDKLSPRQFFIASSIVVGLSSGLAAVVLKSFVHYIGSLVSMYALTYEEFFFFALCPLIGLILTVIFIKVVLKGHFAKGSAEVVFAIVKRSSLLPLKNMYTHMVTSALTVGFGGSTGLESPMVSTGSAIGANFGNTYRLSYKERTILLACGAAAGIAAAFNAPIAGVLFAIEVLLTDVGASAFIPLIVAAASGALLSKIILGDGILLSFSLQQPFDYRNVLFYVVVGVLAGLVSVLYARVFTWIEERMKAVDQTWLRVAAGGILLFGLMILFPPLFGEGYETIKSLAALNPEELIKTSILYEFMGNETHLLMFLGALIFMKIIAAAVTIGSGGNGGSFGPSLFVGAYLGFVFARLVNISGLGRIPETNFTLVAMAGVLSGVFYAPLTSIFLIAEITGGYGLMIPLMIVAALSTLVSHYLEPLSMEGKKLAAKLNSPVDNKDSFLLNKLDLTELIEKNFSRINPDATLKDLINVIAISTRNIFPVVNDQDELLGLIYMDNIRNIMFNTEHQEKMLVRELMTTPAAVIQCTENVHNVLLKFEETNQWNLPVVDGGKYVGFVSKSSLLTKYRAELVRSV
ncbi:chloride channel protein [Pseudochryseolinea flava]|uniref:Chloride channel protein n=1 Tax=Pseudochryseolinea flava TaxID=2059302 RepID=A0A364XWP3_9BACT|nr:chloride channel protein [Pseudochryseolinea flava]RAV98632.1 chloride channel protein [Pseudochryseolinea flava]